MRKLFVTLVLLGVAFYFVKKTSLFSYAHTLWSQAKTEAKNAVPTRFEISRVKNEIAQLEGDINNMVRPIAEYMAAVNRLKKDIRHTQASLDEQKEVLLTMTRDLEGNPAAIVYGAHEFAADKVKQKLFKDFESYQRLEAQLKSQRKLLEAKETSLKATQEQLAKVIAKKREYEVRLAQLEAEEETLQIAKLGSKLQIDDSRATQIEAALQEIEHRHNVQRAEIELTTGSFAVDTIPVPTKSQPKLDLQTIRQYLQGGSTTAAAQ